MIFANYKLFLNIPRYKQFGFKTVNTNIYDSILNMDRYHPIGIGNKWCDLCIDRVNPNAAYGIFGGVYDDQCKNKFLTFKNNLIYKYMYLFYLLNITDVCQFILNNVVQIYNFFYV